MTGAAAARRDALDRACETLSRLGYEDQAADLRELVGELQGQVVKMQVEAVCGAAERVAHQRRAG